MSRWRWGRTVRSLKRVSVQAFISPKMLWLGSIAAVAILLIPAWPLRSGGVPRADPDWFQGWGTILAFGIQTIIFMRTLRDQERRDEREQISKLAIWIEPVPGAKIEHFGVRAVRDDGTSYALPDPHPKHRIMYVNRSGLPFLDVVTMHPEFGDATISVTHLLLPAEEPAEIPDSSRALNRLLDQCLLTPAGNRREFQPSLAGIECKDLTGRVWYRSARGVLGRDASVL